MYIDQPTASRISVYVDESVQATQGFVVSAFVFSDEDLTAEVSSALRDAGLVPGEDEFKSGGYMAPNRVLQGLRDRLIGLAELKGRLAILVTSALTRDDLGRDILACIEEICTRNEVDPSLLDVFVDQGVFRSVTQAREFVRANLGFARTSFFLEQDSKQVLGIQVADAVAHTVGQIIKQDMTLRPKTLLFGEEDGYPEGTPVDLGAALLVRLRYSFFTRPGDVGPNPRLLGWGVFVSPRCHDDVRRIVRRGFRRIWKGCIH